MAFGVPDSLMSSLCAAFDKHFGSNRHIVAVNEGSAIALAIGSYLAKRTPAVVYMQNSGIGNALNPLVSLADPVVYGIPMIIIIGWRAELDLSSNQIPDEPQHRKQGQITIPLLETLGIPCFILQHDSNPRDFVHKCVQMARDRGGPIAIVVRKGTFIPLDEKVSGNSRDEFPSRESVIRAVAGALDSAIPIFATTGMASRELFEARLGTGNEFADFLTVGGMGHAISIASGFAFTNPSRQTVCLDGDGSLLMHLGSSVMASQLPNMLHIVLNNEAHDSVGGQPTLASEVNLSNVASALGYEIVASVSDLQSVAPKLSELLGMRGSAFLEIKCAVGSRPDLGRPTENPQANKDAFLKRHGNDHEGKQT
jgi:phosphonopyruvate decarboxylase